MMAAMRIGIALPLTKIALYQASLLADNLGVRLCAAAMLVMPSALVLLVPLLVLLGAPDETALAAVPLHHVGGPWAAISIALALGFTAAWLRIVFTGPHLVRRPGLRRFVTSGLAVGIAAIALELLVRPGASPQEDAAWLLLASLAVSVFLLAGTLGQPRLDRLHRL